MSYSHLEVLFQDQDLIAVNKPSGLMVHRSPLEPHAVEFALQLVRNQIRRHVYPIHRLDRPTSGVLLFATNGDIARKMSDQFSSHRVEKAYLAVVRGYTDASGRIDHDLTDDRGVSRDAVTEYTRLAQMSLPFPVGRYASCRYSLLCARPKSGRQHQIRRHLKHLFHPIIGDTKYGDGRHNRFFRDHFRLNRLLLMATELTFIHPIKQHEVRITARVPDRIRNFLQETGWADQVPADWI